MGLQAFDVGIRGEIDFSTFVDVLLLTVAVPAVAKMLVRRVVQRGEVLLEVQTPLPHG